MDEIHSAQSAGASGPIQHFAGPIQNGVAGRDYNYNHFDLSRYPEYLAQHEFHKVTGISCSRQAREQLLFLGEKKDFVYRTQLRSAVNAGGLLWSREAQQWEHGSAWPDYMMAALLFSGVVAISAAGLGYSISELDGYARALGVSCSAVFILLGAGSALIRFVLPYKIARRALDALKSRPADPPSGMAPL